MWSKVVSAVDHMRICISKILRWLNSGGRHNNRTTKSVCAEMWTHREKLHNLMQKLIASAASNQGDMIYMNYVVNAVNFRLYIDGENHRTPPPLIFPLSASIQFLLLEKKSCKYTPLEVFYQTNTLKWLQFKRVWISVFDK